MNDDERRAQLGTRLAQIRDELISLGFEATMFGERQAVRKRP
jgi:hypothetical protein